MQRLTVGAAFDRDKIGPWAPCPGLHRLCQRGHVCGLCLGEHDALGRIEPRVKLGSLPLDRDATGRENGFILCRQRFGLPVPQFYPATLVIRQWLDFDPCSDTFGAVLRHDGAGQPKADCPGLAHGFKQRRNSNATGYIAAATQLQPQ